MQRTIIRQTALGLILCYFYLSGALSLCPGEHMVMHGGSAHHESQHSSFICTWMCGAGTFVHSTEQPLPDVLSPAVESPAPALISYLSQYSTEIFHIRPPPYSIA